MTVIALTSALTAAFTAGYLARAWRPLAALLDWAEDQTPGRPVRYWAAQPILAVALGAVFLFRPRRTLANIRAAREEAATDGGAR